MLLQNKKNKPFRNIFLLFTEIKYVFRGFFCVSFCNYLFAIHTFIYSSMCIINLLDTFGGRRSRLWPTPQGKPGLQCSRTKVELTHLFLMDLQRLELNKAHVFHILFIHWVAHNFVTHLSKVDESCLIMLIVRIGIPGLKFVTQI